ncbi:response regulator transcription factor [Candidatus Pristimantibacillus sp. PTI5]|uniref:response regulator transcription factor n=1 Tax=Candidatus Pristimantibacillus sp. PTI5 TaxID=3400422 RepID=UPI003B024817
MIKVLVVDDDKLVRKGLISVMPWQEFGMQVVGEESNGEKALELLETQAVDLLLTDLAMPVMSGIELMRIVRKRYPGIHIVILTLHEDFEYIQEALRLGAIDYIVKVELEKEQFDEILRRIASRIHEQTNNVAVQCSQNESVFLTLDRGYVVVCLDNVSYSDWAADLKFTSHVSVIEADRNSWLLFSDESDDSKLVQQLSSKVEALENGVLVELSDVKGLSQIEIQRWTRDFTERELFYDYHPDNKIITVCVHKRYQHQLEQTDEDLDPLKELWLSAEWLYHDFLFHKLVREIRLLRLPKAKLMGLLYAFVNEWNRLFSQTVLGKITLKEPVNSWFQIELWLDGIRELIRLEANKTNYSQEIINCILKAEQMMRAEMEKQLTAAEVANRMNMSRSYFSQCFKAIIGNTFNEHIRMIRMEKAKQYLLSTNKTILWIAENTGYLDEKYFSRTFREHTGMLPSEYRLRKIQSRN